MNYHTIALRAYCYRILDEILADAGLDSFVSWNVSHKSFLRPDMIDRWRYENMETGNLLCHDIRQLTTIVSDRLGFDETRYASLLAQLFWDFSNDYRPYKITDDSIDRVSMYPLHTSTALLAFCYASAKRFLPSKENSNTLYSDALFQKYIDETFSQAVKSNMINPLRD